MAHEPIQDRIDVFLCLGCPEIPFLVPENSKAPAVQTIQPTGRRSKTTRAYRIWLIRNHLHPHTSKVPFNPCPQITRSASVEFYTLISKKKSSFFLIAFFLYCEKNLISDYCPYLANVIKRSIFLLYFSPKKELLYMLILGSQASSVDSQRPAATTEMP